MPLVKFLLLPVLAAIYHILRFKLFNNKIQTFYNAANHKKVRAI